MQSGELTWVQSSPIGLVPGQASEPLPQLDALTAGWHEAQARWTAFTAPISFCARLKSLSPKMERLIRPDSRPSVVGQRRPEIVTLVTDGACSCGTRV